MFKGKRVGLLLACVVITVFSVSFVHLLTRNSGGTFKFPAENRQFIFLMFLYFVLRWDISNEIKKSEAGLRKEIRKTNEELDSVLESWQDKKVSGKRGEM